MTKTQRNEYYIECLGLDALGFKLTKVDEEETEYLFEKNTGEITVFLNFGIQKMRLQGTGIWLAFNEIENVIDSYRKKYQIGNKDPNPMTIVFNKLYPSCDYLSEIHEIPFDNEEKINEVAEVMKKHICKVFIPLWEKYSELKVVNEEIINKVPLDKLSDYISGISMHLKVLIIMKKCNNPAYQEYLDNQLKALLELSESALGKSQAEQYFNDSFFWEKQYKMMLEMDVELKQS
jgi:hypothetical protein